MKPRLLSEAPDNDLDPKPAPDPEAAPAGAALNGLDPTIFKDVQVQLQAKLGAVELTVEALLALRAGSVVKLDLKMNEPIELRLNQLLVARGEIVAVDDHFGIRITDVAKMS